MKCNHVTDHKTTVGRQPYVHRWTMETRNKVSGDNGKAWNVHLNMSYRYVYINTHRTSSSMIHYRFPFDNG